jgi:hypothetical protein
MSQLKPSSSGQRARRHRRLMQLNPAAKSLSQHTVHRFQGVLNRSLRRNLFTNLRIRISTSPLDSRPGSSVKHMHMPTLIRLKRKGASPRFAFSAFYNLFHHKQFIWEKYPYSTSGLPARPSGCTFNQLFNTSPGSRPLSPASAARTLHLSEDQLPTVVVTFHSANLCSRLQHNCKFFCVDLGLKKTCLLLPPEKMQVRLKSETVTLGVPMDPVGTYVEPKDCNALITEPEVIAIHTRKFYVKLPHLPHSQTHHSPHNGPADASCMQSTTCTSTSQSSEPFASTSYTLHCSPQCDKCSLRTPTYHQHYSPTPIRTQHPSSMLCPKAISHLGYQTISTPSPLTTTTNTASSSPSSYNTLHDSTHVHSSSTLGPGYLRC